MIKKIIIRLIKVCLPIFDRCRFLRNLLLKTNIRLFPILSEEKYVTNLNFCKENFKNYDFSEENLKYFLYLFRFYGFWPDELFFMNIVDKPIKEIKKEYLSEGELHNFCVRIGNFGEVGKIFFDKYLTYQRFKKYFYRSIIKIDLDTSFSEFESFIKDKESFLIKEVGASRGRDVSIVYTKDISDIQSFFNENFKSGNYIVEEKLKNAEELRVFNPDSLNTVRVPAFNTKNGVILLPYASLRAGRAGSFVDSCGRGGLSCSIDSKTGIVISDWFDEFGNTFEKHPDTGVAVRGFKLPKWDDIYNIVCELYKIAPEVKYTGWDFSYIEKDGQKHWAIVEGNGGGQLSFFQARLGKGLKKEFYDITRQI